jgi:SAM-dependent methyltransferase
MGEKTLIELQAKFNFTTDKGTIHSYLEYYDVIFAPFKSKDINLIEVGVQSGGSLLLWNKYFSQNSKIFGFDIHQKHVDDFNNMATEQSINNATAFCSDAYIFDYNTLEPKHFDIIIDDGSHYLECQKKAVETFKNKLTPGGIFIIEDINPENYQYFVDLATVTPNSEIVDRRGLSPHRYDDILFVFKNVERQVGIEPTI